MNEVGRDRHRGGDNVKHVEDQVRRKADEFIKDYQAVNPDRRGSDRLKSP